MHTKSESAVYVLFSKLQSLLRPGMPHRVHKCWDLTGSAYPSDEDPIVYIKFGTNSVTNRITIGEALTEDCLSTDQGRFR